MTPDIVIAAPHQSLIKTIGEAWITSNKHPTTSTISRRSASLLARFQHANSLTTTVESFIDDFGLSQAERQILLTDVSDLLAQGWLVEPSKLVNASPAQPEHQPVAVERILMATRNRGVAMPQTVAAWMKSAQEFGRSPAWHICDTTDHADEAQTAKQHLISSARDHHAAGLNLYSTHTVREQALALAKHSGVDPALCRFALLAEPFSGFTLGASHNALLLANAGHPLVIIDDDVWPRFHLPENANEGLTVGDISLQNKLQRFPSRERLLAKLPLLSVDALALHEKWLGHSGLAALQTNSVDWASSTCTSLMLKRLLGDSPRIRVTKSGYVGDDTIGFPSVLTSLLQTAEKGVPFELESREALGMVSRANIASCKGLVGLHFGLDAREILPPFMPVHRGSDSLGGIFINSLIPDALGLDLPLATWHDPSPARPPYPSLAQWLKEGDLIPNFSSMMRVMLKLASLPKHAGTAETRFYHLGRAFQELGKLQSGDFINAYRKIVWQNTSSKLIACRAHLNDPRVLLYADWMEQRLMDDAIIPGQLRSLGIGSLPALAEHIQSLCHWYGRLLEAWPSLWKSSLQMGGRVK